MKPTAVRHDFASARVRLLLKELGITGPPVDAAKVLERLGARVHYHMHESVDYAFSFVDGKGRFHVSIDISNPGRMNWSATHELGHWVLKHFEQYDVDRLTNGGVVERLTEEERRILDREADIFAREFLMPKAWVRAAAGGSVGYDMVPKLAEKFMVSHEAMRIRLEELGLLPGEEPLPF